jgi:hypothetical protein
MLADVPYHFSPWEMNFSPWQLTAALIGAAIFALGLAGAAILLVARAIGKNR